MPYYRAVWGSNPDGMLSGCCTVENGPYPTLDAVPAMRQEERGMYPDTRVFAVQAPSPEAAGQMLMDPVIRGRPIVPDGTIIIEIE